MSDIGYRLLFTDCYFYDMFGIINSNYATFRRCTIENFEHSLTPSSVIPQYLEIYNSRIIGPGSASSPCVKLGDGSVLEHSTIKHCDFGLRLYGDWWTDHEPPSIRYNSFEMNTVSIAIIYGQSVVQFNNFINDDVSIEMHSSTYDCDECNYNYFGIPSFNHPDFRTVLGLKIRDECSENAYWSGVATWYPWYLNALDLSNISDVPPQDTLPVKECIGYDPHPEVIGNKLNHIYLPNTTTTLTAADSPYYVIRSVEIRENTVFNIANGVEIIFETLQHKWSYNIKVLKKGILNVGCYDLNLSTITTRGTYLSDKIYIHTNWSDSVWDNGMEFETQDDTSYTSHFCNVLFENVAFVANSADANLEFENCEFSHIENIIEPCQYCHFRFTSCYFHDLTVTFTRYSPTVTFENCLFEHFTVDSSKAAVQYISNSEFIGNGISECLQLESSVLEYSNISNCSVAIQSFGDNVIRYNRIENNPIAIHSIEFSHYTANHDTIQYNNFIHNDINIQLEGDKHCNDCNYNYFENQSEARIAQSMDDVCDGYSEILITWQPWYPTPINVDDLSNLPAEVITTNNYCPGSDPYPSLIGSRLDIIYVTHTITTLNATKSPYYIKNNVTIQEGAILNIPSATEIVFVGDFYIHVEGSFNVGCDVINTTGANHRGLYSVDNKVHIHGMFNNRTGGVIFTASNGTFCNTLFEGLNAAIIYQRTDIHIRSTFDHCEFVNINTVTSAQHIYNNYRILRMQYFDFTNCYFHDISLVNKYGTIVFDNCLIEDFEISVTHYTVAGRIMVFNSEIYGNGVQPCIGSYGVCDEKLIVSNSTIVNCGIGLRTRDQQHIKYNTFINNSIAINTYFDRDWDCDYKITLSIQYNNFINNDINIQLGGEDCDNCTYNYFSASSINQSLIGATLNHVCTGYGSQLVIFWPWLMEPYLHLNDSVDFRTFDFMDCDSIHSAISYTMGTTAPPTTAVPTTAEPTTSAPTTAAPTTAKPTTTEPTTSVPTTSVPTTSEPTTAEPTTSEPTTSEPTTAWPTTSEPTTAYPTTMEPTTTAWPTTSEPTTAYPTTMEPTTTSTIVPDTTSLPEPISSTITTMITSQETTIEATPMTSLGAPQTSTRTTRYSTAYSTTRVTESTTNTWRTHVSWSTDLQADTLLTDPNDIVSDGTMHSALHVRIVMMVFIAQLFVF
eukprot:755123_1